MKALLTILFLPIFSHAFKDEFAAALKCREAIKNSDLVMLSKLSGKVEAERRAGDDVTASAPDETDFIADDIWKDGGNFVWPQGTQSVVYVVNSSDGAIWLFTNDTAYKADLRTSIDTPEMVNERIRALKAAGESKNSLNTYLNSPSAKKVFKFQPNNAPEICLTYQLVLGPGGNYRRHASIAKCEATSGTPPALPHQEQRDRSAHEAIRLQLETQLQYIAELAKRPEPVDYVDEKYLQGIESCKSISPKASGLAEEIKSAFRRPSRPARASPGHQ